MTDNTNTPFNKRCEILEDLWMTYRSDDDFTDFMEYNDLALPLAYAVANNIIESNKQVEVFVNEAWDLLLKGFDIEDNGFDNLDELFEFAGQE